jgi:ATP-dependent DNA helicase RecQ
MALRQMGFSAFRPGQEAVVNRIMTGKDVICILATGGGKSMCFVVPSLCLDWPTIIFSPLQALMRDQVLSLQEKGIRAGRVSGDQNDTLNAKTLELWMRGECQFMFVAPERMHNPQFKHAIKIRPCKHMVVDEAHCLSTWSLTFRESYRQLGDFVREQNPLVISAFTATLPQWAEEEVRTVLGLQNAVTMNYYSRRDNLDLRSRMYPGDEAFIKFLFEETQGPVLVYFYSIKRLEEMVKTMRDMHPSEVTYYHGELGDAAKTNNMSAFMSGRARICLATSAFGMGIDKGDIRWVVHRDIPGTPEDLSQQIGRAGRDGKPSTCMLFFDRKSVSTQEFMIMVGAPHEDTVRHVFDTIKRKCDLAGGIASLNTNDIAIASGLDRLYEESKQIPACVRILAASRVIDRQEEKDTTARVRFLEITSGSKPFVQTRDAIIHYGQELRDGRFEFDVEVVAKQGLGMPDETTLKNRLRQWKAAQWIEYEPPARIRPIKVIGHIEMVPWDTIREERAKAEGKLAAVIKYAHIEDSAKQTFLENELGSVRALTPV